MAPCADEKSTDFPFIPTTAAKAATAEAIATISNSQDTVFVVTSRQQQLNAQKHIVTNQL